MDGDETQGAAAIQDVDLLVGFGVLVVDSKRGSRLRISGTEPLKVFDHLVQSQASDPPLSPAVAADAEHTLKTLIADGKQPTMFANGARSRLAIVLGESGRWAEAQRELLWTDHSSFIPVVLCAYGRDDKACAKLSACDDGGAAARPWTKAELYAALVRCAVLPLLCGIGMVSVLVALKLVTAWAYDRTGSLWPSVLVHASGNALGLLSALI